MSRRTLITGAGGFVGSHLAEGFARLGDAVTALDVAFDAPTRTRLAGTAMVEAMLTRETLGQLPAFDLVVHGAAITTPPAALGMSDVTHTKANIDMLLDCLDFAVAIGARHFVFISSSGVFEIGDAADVLLETTVPTGTMPYSVAKRAGEIITDAANSDLLQAIAIRLGPIYGPHEAARASRVNVSLVRRWLDQALDGQAIVVTTPEARRDWTFAPDLPLALEALLALRPALTGTVHFTSAAMCDDRQLAASIAALVDGTVVRIAPDDTPVRAPMTGARLDLPAFYPWTPLADGLRQTIVERALA